MISRHILALGIAFALSACGGEPFGATAADGGATGGAAGAGPGGASGAPGGGSGGAQAGQGGTGAQGGATGGEAGQGGSAGVPGGTGGQGGSAGAPGGTGGAAGGTGGTPSCTAPEAFSAAALPPQWTWSGWSMKSGTSCASCAGSPCGQCTAAWWGDSQGVPPKWVAPTTVRVLFEAYCGELPSKMTPVMQGTCGSETLCALQCGGLRGMDLQLKASGDGYVLSSAQPLTSNICTLGGFNSCKSLPPNAPANITASQDADLGSVLVGHYFPCQN